MELIELCLQLRGTITPAAAKLLSDNAHRIDKSLVDQLNDLCGAGQVTIDKVEIAVGGRRDTK